MKLIKGNCIEVLKTLEENSVDSVVTDPPYEIGFMGKSWDASGIANNPEMWKECLRVLKPGGYLLSFSATRTYHRMAVAIEDAGFEVRDMIEWVYGSGFPKSHNIGKAVDKLQGNEREVVGKNPYSNINIKGEAGYMVNDGSDRVVLNKTKGTSEWEGWGTALKPAHEPICMARKPLAEKTVAENCLKYGTGGINIDESRVGTSKEGDPNRFVGQKGEGRVTLNASKYENSLIGQEIDNNIGRFPANLIHDNSEEVRECFPESTSGAKKANQENYNHEGKEFVATLGASVNEYQASSGNASRFFKSIIYQAKPSKKERNAGCEALEDKPLAFSNQAKAELKRGNANFNGGDAKGHGNKIRHLQNNHPTVKPIALMEYLINMVTPKGGVVLDPFMGSGTTGCASVKNGFDFIGIDLEDEYIKIATARINHYKIF